MCTGIRFTSTSGAMYFGRNLDWTQGYGERVVMTPPAARVPAAAGGRERMTSPEGKTKNRRNSKLWQSYL